MAKKKKNFQFIPEMTADPHIVKQLTVHLLTAFEQFVEEYRCSTPK